MLSSRYRRCERRPAPPQRLRTAALGARDPPAHGGQSNPAGFEMPYADRENRVSGRLAERLLSRLSWARRRRIGVFAMTSAPRNAVTYAGPRPAGGGHAAPDRPRNVRRVSGPACCSVLVRSPFARARVKAIPRRGAGPARGARGVRRGGSQPARSASGGRGVSGDVLACDSVPRFPNERVEVLGDEHGLDTGQRKRSRRVDGVHAGSGKRAADKARVQHAGPRDIIDKRSMAGQQASVFHPRDAGPRITGCDGFLGHGKHSNPSSMGRYDRLLSSCSASLPDRRFSLISI